jgi:hypothetical protein
MLEFGEEGLEEVSILRWALSVNKKTLCLFETTPDPLALTLTTHLGGLGFTANSARPSMVSTDWNPNPSGL